MIEWTEEMDAQLRSLRALGVAVNDCAKRMSVGREQLRRRMSELGLPTSVNVPPLITARPWRPGDPRPKIEV